jgi:hypothetical protein
VELTEAFTLRACSFKNPHFQEEREWRLVDMTHNDPSTAPFNLQYRTSGGAIIPYTKISLLFKEERRSASAVNWAVELKEIIFGPGLNRETTERSLRYMTATFGDDVQIRQSAIRVRV